LLIQSSHEDRGREEAMRVENLLPVASICVTQRPHKCFHLAEVR
jgi:hypothetical protein